MDQNSTTSEAFGVQLDRARDAPTRFAFATLVGSDRLWIGLVIGLPLAFLLLTPVHDVFISLAAGLPIGISLWLMWLSHEFVNPRLSVDTDERTLTKSKPYDLGKYSPVDVDDVDRVSIIQFSDAALVKIHYKQWRFSHPPDAAITASRTSELKSQLEQMGVEISIYEVTPRSILSDSLQMRIAITPIAIIGSLLAVWYLYGIEAFLTNVVIVPAIVMVGYGLYGVVWRYRLRRSDLEKGREPY